MLGWVRPIIAFAVIAGFVLAGSAFYFSPPAQAQPTSTAITELCVNLYNGDARVPRTEGQCASTEYALEVTDDPAIDVCVNRYNGNIRVLRTGACASTETLFTIIEDDMTICVNRYNGDLRYSRTGSCASTENVAAFTVVIVARDDAFSAHTNVPINVPNSEGVLSNDTYSGPVSIAWPSSTINGGQIEDRTSGGFIYHPPAGFSGEDFFTYELTANGGISVASVTISVSGTTTWFVDNSRSEPGNGTLSTPFNSLSSVNNDGNDPDGEGDIIYLFEGNSATTAYAGGIELEAEQQLIGQKYPVPDLQLPPFSVDLPSTTINAPVIGNDTGHGITVANDTSILGVATASTDGDGVTGSSIFGDVEIEDVSVSEAGSGTDLTIFNMTGQLSLKSVDFTSTIDLTGPFTTDQFDSRDEFAALMVEDSELQLFNGSTIDGGFDVTHLADGKQITSGLGALAATMSFIEIDSGVEITGNFALRAQTTTVNQAAPVDDYDFTIAEEAVGGTAILIDGGEIRAGAATISGGDATIELDHEFVFETDSPDGTVDFSATARSFGGDAIVATNAGIYLDGTTVEGGKVIAESMVAIEGTVLDSSDVDVTLEVTHGAGVNVEDGLLDASNSAQLFTGRTANLSTTIANELTESGDVSSDVDETIGGRESVKARNSDIHVDGANVDAFDSNAIFHDATSVTTADGDVAQVRSTTTHGHSAITTEVDRNESYLAEITHSTVESFTSIGLNTTFSAVASDDSNLCVHFVGNDLSPTINGSVGLTAEAPGILGVTQSEVDDIADDNTGVDSVVTDGNIATSCGAF